MQGFCLWTPMWPKPLELDPSLTTPITRTCLRVSVRATEQCKEKGFMRLLHYVQLICFHILPRNQRVH
jgi:hypothetical protein